MIVAMTLGFTIYKMDQVTKCDQIRQTSADWFNTFETLKMQLNKIFWQ